MFAQNSQHDSHLPAPLWGMWMAVGAITFFAFLTGVSGEFVNWDDDANLVHNEGFRGFDGEHLNWMFTTFSGGHYQPLAWLSFAVDHAIWGMNPFGYHLTNLLLHCLASMLFFAVALNLLRRGFDLSESNEGVLRWAALIAALTFAIHPLRVESVSWVTERRDVLSGVFVMLTLMSYLRYVQLGRTGFALLLVSWFMFALTLMTKASAVPLPFVLLVLDVYPLRRLQASVGRWKTCLAEKLPFFLLAGGASVLAIKAQESAQAWQSIASFDLWSRLATVMYGLCWYVFKFFVPTNLCALYPIPERNLMLGWTFVASTAIVIGATVAAIVLRRRVPALLACVICYALLLGPVSGIAQSGEQFVADRYGYLSLLPFSILVAAGLLRVYMRGRMAIAHRRFSRLLFGFAVVYLVGLTLLTAAQATVWRSSESLWTHAIEGGSPSNIAHVNLADALRDKGDQQEAARHYQQAAKLNPDDAKAHNGMGITALAMGRPVQALAHLERAIKLVPTHPKYQYNIAEVLAGFGRLEEAGGHYRAALKAAPCFVQAMSRLAMIESDLGRFAAAKKTLEDGLDCSPGSAELGGQLAWLLATCPDQKLRDGQRAVQLAESLCESTSYGDAWALSTLGVALAETGAFERAVTTQDEAIQLVSGQGNGRAVAEMRRRRALFANREKYRRPLVSIDGQP